MGRTPCCSKEGLNRGAWTALEDQILRDYINTHGEGKWRNIPKESGLKRCGKSCRLRWLNYLRPDIKRGNISQEEQDLIIRLHKLLGNRWSLIAGRLPGRTDNEIKNYWNTTLGKKARGEETKESKEKKKNTMFKSSTKTPPLKIAEPSTPIWQKGALRRSEVKAETGNKYLVDNAAVESKSSDEDLSNKSQEIENPQDISMPTEFNFGELLLSDIPDSEFWKLCQFDGCTKESGNSGGATNEELSVEQSLSFCEEMLQDWISDDGFSHQN